MTAAIQDQTVSNLFETFGLCSGTKLASTLQGSVWRANSSDKKNESLVIKVTSQSLHSKRISIIDGKEYPVLEDIVLEQAILKYLTDFEECPNSIVKYKRFLHNRSDFYIFIMEDGGSGMFDFAIKAHECIKRGVLSVSNWHNTVKFIFKQMIEAVEFIHSKNVCHMDVSLENLVINNVKLVVKQDHNKKSQMITMQTEGVQCKLCDFGLAQIFSNGEYKSSRFCGKSVYKSPEIHDKMEGYNAKKNDIFCLGVCLFILITGSPPWARAAVTDNAFKLIFSGRLKELLKLWSILHYFDDNLLDLFESVFKYESERTDLKNIKNHQWLNN